MDFYHLQENIKNSYWIHDSLKTASKKVVQKAGEIADAVTKSKFSARKQR